MPRGRESSFEVRKTSEELVDLRFSFVKGQVTVHVRVSGRTSEGLVYMMCDWEWGVASLSQLAAHNNDEIDSKTRRYHLKKLI